MGSSSPVADSAGHRLARCAVVEGLDAKQQVPGLEGPAGLPLVTAELVRRGWPEHDVRAVLGGNDLRLLRAELGVPLADRT